MARRRQWHPTPVLLPGKSHGWRSLVGCRSWGRWGSDRTERLPFHFHFHASEKEMATHSSVLAWIIPGMAEPGGLPSMESHRVGPQLKQRCSSSSSRNSESPLRATCSLQAHMQSRRWNYHHGAHFPDDKTAVKRLDQAHTAKHVKSQAQT